MDEVDSEIKGKVLGLLICFYINICEEVLRIVG